MRSPVKAEAGWLRLSLPPRFPLPLWLVFPLAVAAGMLLDASFPGRAWWPLAPVAIALLLLILLGRGFWAGALVGLVGGVGFWLTQIDWLTLYLGPLPWLALGLTQAIFFALGMALIAVVLRRGPVTWPSRLGRLGVIPVVVAGLWTAREGITAIWPYGGFSWGRLAMGQTEGGFASLLPWLGAAAVGFTLVWLAAFVVQLAREPLFPLTRVALGGVALIALLIVPAYPVMTSGSTRVAAVQGGVDASLFSRLPAGTVLGAHAEQTLAISDEVDVVVWPENGADLDPLRSPRAAAVLNALTKRLDAPLVVGSITRRDGALYNSSLLWEPGRGLVDIYDKAHPVPFAEYVPDRELWRPFAPGLIDLITRDYTPGTADNVFDLRGTRAGIAICYDIADDALIRDMMAGDAQLILAQTNNADFGRTDESVQQLAVARMRGLETGRSVVNISTVGTSAIMGPDGATLDALPPWQPGTMIIDVPGSNTVTPATFFGARLEWLFAGLGLAGAAICVVPRRRGG